jgi:hypothetical protein
MKIKQITENSYENLTILSELADIILDNTPEIPYGTNKILYLQQLRKQFQFHNIYVKYENNEKVKKPLQKLQSTIIKYVNDPNYVDPYYGKKPNYGGYYSDDLNTIVVFLYHITNDKDFNKINNSHYEKTKAILIHELRHLFQYSQYPEYFNNKKAYNHPYDSRHIELDASWSDIVGNIPKDDIFNSFNNLPELADEVISKLSYIKKLSPKLKKHYKIKTIKYFSETLTKTINEKFSKIAANHTMRIINDMPPKEYINDEIDITVEEIINELNHYIEYNIGKHLNQKQISIYKSRAKKSLNTLFQNYK